MGVCFKELVQHRLKSGCTTSERMSKTGRQGRERYDDEEEDLTGCMVNKLKTVVFDRAGVGNTSE